MRQNDARIVPRGGSSLRGRGLSLAQGEMRAAEGHDGPEAQRGEAG
jgi:hypothetical protein